MNRKDPYTIGAQEGTYDYDRGPELYSQTGPSEAVKMYDEVYKEKIKATNRNKRYC